MNTSLKMRSTGHLSHREREGPFDPAKAGEVGG
jgi:hypothetical protein